MASYPDLKLHVAGDWRKADGQPGFSPADESVLGTLPHAKRADLDDALAAVAQGFKIWSRTSPAKRAEIMLEAVRIMRERVEDMTIAMTSAVAIAETPFGGVKDSGFGREGGTEGLQNYKVVKNVSHLTV